MPDKANKISAFVLPTTQVYTKDSKVFLFYLEKDCPGFRALFFLFLKKSLLFFWNLDKNLFFQ